MHFLDFSQKFSDFFRFKLLLNKIYICIKGFNYCTVKHKTQWVVTWVTFRFFILFLKFHKASRLFKISSNNQKTFDQITCMSSLVLNFLWISFSVHFMLKINKLFKTFYSKKNLVLVTFCSCNGQFFKEKNQAFCFHMWLFANVFKYFCCFFVRDRQPELSTRFSTFFKMTFGKCLRFQSFAHIKTSLNSLWCLYC